jgi:hypothetical protein
MDSIGEVEPVISAAALGISFLSAVTGRFERAGSTLPVSYFGRRATARR